MEQTGKRDFDKETQDVFVPWALAKKSTEGKKSAEFKKPKANSRPQGVKKKDRKKNSDHIVDAKPSESVVTEELSKLTIQEDRTDNQGFSNSNSSKVSNSLQDQSSTAADSLSSSSEHTSTTTTSAAAAVSAESNQPTYEENAPAPAAETPVYNRYYHLFHKGELEDLVLQTNKASIVQQGYDRDNWWCILEKTHHE